MNIHAHGDGLRRRDEILRIVGEMSVHSQDELLALLKKRGFKVTQPTLSRDLRELVVIRTPAASAQPVASAIDAASIDGVLGTIGGDDTIFVAFRTPSAASAFSERVRRTIGVRRRTAR